MRRVAGQRLSVAGLTPVRLAGRMRRTIAALLLALSLPLAAHAAEPEASPAPAPDLRIAELLPAPDAALGQREFIEVLNAGAAEADLAGWRIRDAPTASNATNEFTFGPLRLAPGQRVVVWSNGSADAFGPAWSSSPSKAVWNDAGDAATLLDPAGQVRDWVAYGSATQPAPAGFSAAKPAAPGKGRSLASVDGVWTAGEPTPGFAPGQQGGAVAARVGNVAPTLLLAAPATAAPGEAVAVRLDASDGNGPDDLVAWTLSSQGQAVRGGNGSFAGTVQLVAPERGPWLLSATARDAAGANANATATVTVVLPRLAVALPPGGALRFPDLRPGDRNVTSLDAFTLRNDGDAPARPLLDVSPLRAGAAAIPVERNLWLGVAVDGATQWLRYDAPLQPLPELAPGQSASVTLRIGEVPRPAAAGLYGTTFTVVAA